MLTPLPPVPAASLRQAWLDRVTGDPAGYLALRTELFGRQLALTRSARQVLIPGVIENPYGYAIIFGGLNSAALDYLGPFTEPHVGVGSSSHRSTAGRCTRSGSICWWQRLPRWRLLRPGATRREPAVGALALGALALQTGLYVLAMGTEYRFEFPAVAAAMLAGAVRSASRSELAPPLEAIRTASFDQHARRHRLARRAGPRPPRSGHRARRGPSGRRSSASSAQIVTLRSAGSYGRGWFVVTSLTPYRAPKMSRLL